MLSEEDKQKLFDLFQNRERDFELAHDIFSPALQDLREWFYDPKHIHRPIDFFRIDEELFTEQIRNFDMGTEGISFHVFPYDYGDWPVRDPKWVSIPLGLLVDPDKHFKMCLDQQDDIAKRNLEYQRQNEINRDRNVLIALKEKYGDDMKELQYE